MSMFDYSRFRPMPFKQRKRFILFIPFLVMVYPAALPAETLTEIIALQSGDFEHIKFSRIKPNQFISHEHKLQVEVDESASFLMQAFDHIRSIKRVSFEWRSDGLPKIKSVRDEEQKSGDDAVFKLGLLIKTDGSISNPLVPKWMKRVETLLNFPSEEMIYLVANAKHAVGEQWTNPYNKRVTMTSIGSTTSEQGWKLAHYEFDNPVDVVAIWLMADGDNTHSRFSVHIKNIKIE